MTTALQVALGGAIGAMLRFVVVSQVARVAAAPLGTLAVNVIGSFAMGVATIFLLRRGEGALIHLSPLVMTGIMGGFTTFSAFSSDTLWLVEHHRWGWAALYMGGSVVLGVGAFVLALYLFRGFAP